MAVILPDVANTAKIIHKGRLQGLPFVNTFHVQAEAPIGGQNALNALATAVHNAYFNAFIPLLNNVTFLDSTTVIDLTNRQSGFAIHTESHPGTIVSTNPPANSVAYCISWIINDRYRGGHPRMYLPAASTTEYTNGRTLSQTKIDSLLAAGNGYLTSLGNMTVAVTTWTPVAVRYYSQHQLLATPLVRPVGSVAVHTRIDSMRRRTGKETG